MRLEDRIELIETRIKILSKIIKTCVDFSKLSDRELFEMAESLGIDVDSVLSRSKAFKSSASYKTN